MCVYFVFRRQEAATFESKQPTGPRKRNQQGEHLRQAAAQARASQRAETTTQGGQ